MEVFTASPRDRAQQRFSGAEHVVFPVPHGRGGLGGGGLHGLSKGPGSTAVCGAEHVDIPVPHGRGKLGGGGLHAVQGFLPGSSSTADIPPGGGMGDSRGRVKRRAGFLPEPSSSASAEQNVDSPAPVVRSRRARRTGEQNVDIPVPRMRPNLGRSARGWFRGRLVVVPGSRTYGVIETSAGDFLRVPVSWYDYFPTTGMAVIFTVRVVLDGVTEADEIEF